MTEGSNLPVQPATRVDPITGAVIQGALENIAIEMGHKLMRMSYSIRQLLQALHRQIRMQCLPKQHL